MAELTEDPIAFPHAVGLIDALPAELAKRNLPAIECFSGVLPGALVALDYVYSGCGAMAWSRISQLYPSTNFPLNDQAVLNPNQMAPLAQSYELGIIRAAPVPDNGEAPSVEEQFDATRLVLADQRAILAVICRYFASHDIPFLLGAWSPVGPDGGVVGGYWSVTAGGQ